MSCRRCVLQIEDENKGQERTLRVTAALQACRDRPESRSHSLPRQILDIPDGHRAPAPPQNGSCDHPFLLLEPGNLASSPMSLASPQPSGQTSREEHRGAVEELASIPNDKGKLRRPRQQGPLLFLPLINFRPSVFTHQPTGISF